MTNTQNTEFIVMASSANMPQCCWGEYARVAVVEVEIDREPEQPRMISDRARSVVRVVETWERLNVGRTERCAFAQALEEAIARTHALNTDALGPDYAKAYTSKIRASYSHYYSL